MEPKNGQNMNASGNDIMTTLDEAEDLTLFADESFDTDEVDLFEFTGEEDSPLTRLKSIILSLDWEITDDILQELADEINELQTMWQGDKVAQVYLQGLDKIGRYLRSEGAYAHPNAIKLLLTFYYNFEKIISSRDITGEAIASLLKADVRKFKILQYQISQTTPVAESMDAVAEDGQAGIAAPAKAGAGSEPLQQLKATILGLEWEVTDKGLDEFNQQLTATRESCSDNKSAQVLIQGLQALGAYITDERADAHPEAFTLLHSFYEGLETLLVDQELDEDKRQELLVDRVGRLNALKAAIADATAAATGSTADDVVDEILQPPRETEDLELALDDVDEEEISVADEPPVEPEESPAAADHSDPGREGVAAMETADTPYPDDVLDPAAIQPVTNEVADDFIEEELSIGTGITPALAGSDEKTGFDEGAEKTSPDSSTGEDLEEQLDLLFADSEDTMFDEDSDHPVAGGDDGVGLSFDDGESSSVDTEGGILPALADTDEEGGFSEDETVASLDDAPVDDLEEKLDFFFGSSEEVESPGQETPQEEAEEQAAGAEDESPVDAVAPALADAADEVGFDEEQVAGEIADDAGLDIEEKLDSFFGIPEEESDDMADETELTDSLLPADDEEEQQLGPALADAPDEGGFDEEKAADEIADKAALDIEGKLDSFFGTDEEESGDMADETELTDSLLPADDGEEQEQKLAPALADASEEGGFDEEKMADEIADKAALDIEGKLDSFFGTSEEEEAVSDTLPGESEVEDETPVADEIAPALAFESEDAAEPAEETELSEGLEEKLDAFFSEAAEEEAEPAQEEVLETTSLLTSLGTCLARLTEAPSADAVAEGTSLLGSLREEPGQSTEQKVLTQLLDSVLAVLARRQQDLPDQTGELVDYLYQNMTTESPEPEMLVKAVGRFTSWQQQLMDDLLGGEPQVEQPEPAMKLTVISEEIRSGFTDLRSVLAEELESLRRELTEKEH